MKTTVLAFVLVTALAAGAQDATPQQTQPAAPSAGGQQPAAGQQAGGQSSTAAPEIKDPAEYNAYIGAVHRRTRTQKSVRWRRFLPNIPNSVMKTTALELLMATYQQTGNQAKVVETAKRCCKPIPVTCAHWRC